MMNALNLMIDKLYGLIPLSFQETYARMNDNDVHYAIKHLYNNIDSSNLATSLGVSSYFTKPLVIVNGDKQNLLAVTSYGDNEQFDSAARKPLDFISMMAGTENIINMSHDKSVQHRKAMKPFLTMSEKMQTVFNDCQHEFKTAFANWDFTRSLQSNISYPTIKIIAKNVLGLDKVTLEDSETLQTAGKMLRESSPGNADFASAIDKMQVFNKNILSRNQNSIFKKNNYLQQRLELEGTIDKGASNLLVENNLSSLIMMGIVKTHADEAITKRLREELSTISTLDLKTLRSLPYLDCVYKETLRYLSPTPFIVRETSQATALTIKDETGIKKTYPISCGSMLFAPIRRIHHDAKYWHEPEQFNPDRFLDKDVQAHFFPFSLGTRACPASTSFNEIVFKTALIESLAHTILLDKEVEEIPADSLDSRWHQTYFRR